MIDDVNFLATMKIQFGIKRYFKKKVATDDLTSNKWQQLKPNNQT